jgi:hypothetical protein
VAVLDRLTRAIVSTAPLHIYTFSSSGFVRDWKAHNGLVCGGPLGCGPGPSRRSPGVSPDMLHAMTLDLVFDHLGTRLNGPRAGGTQIVINWHFAGSKESGRRRSRMEH